MEDIPQDVSYIFEAAVAHVRQDKIRTDHVLKLYGLFKQATVGDAAGPAPKMLQVVSTAKWKAWKANEGMSTLDAMNAYIDFTAKVCKRFKPEEYMLDAKEFAPVQDELSDLPPVAPPRKHGRRRKTLESKDDIAQSGFDPVTEAVDSEDRVQLYERLSVFYNQVDATRLNRGIGDVVEVGLEKGEEFLNQQLKKKYGVTMEEVEQRQQQEEQARFQAATLKRNQVVAKTHSKEDPLEKQLTQFYWQYDPSMLSKGIEHIVRFGHNKGLDMLNQKLYKKYGSDLDKMATDPRPSTFTSHPTVSPQRSIGNESSDTLGNLSTNDLMQVELPSHIKPYLMNYYAKYDPSKIRNKGVRTVYEWTKRNGLNALNKNLKKKYNESLDEFIDSVNNLRKELIDFYTVTDKQRLMGGIDQILTWGMKNGRIALNVKLRNKYGYDLDNFEDNDLIKSKDDDGFEDVVF